MNLDAQSLKSHLGLQEHPEGGYFRETYRSEGHIKSDSVETGMTGSRSYSTAIYFMLDEHRPSKFHRIKSDELWHFHLGSPLEIFEIDENDKVIRTVLGSDLSSGQVLQHVVKKNRWFASRLMKQAFDFGLVGCTVAPGFAFEDFAMANMEELKHVSNIETFKDLIHS